MSKIPSVLKICGKPWKIVRCKQTSLEVDAFGKVNMDKLEISIMDEQPRPLEKDTALHEIIHAIDESLDLGLKEHQVEVLGCSLQQVFADNPELLKYLSS